MKKILQFTLLVLSLFLLVSCQSEQPITDTVPPSIIGATDIFYTIGQTPPNYLNNVTAIDNIDGVITSSIIVDDSLVDLTTPGFYDLFYEVRDQAGNLYRKKVSVIVLEAPGETDLEPPVFSGISHLTYYVGDTLPNYLLGIAAYDAKDGNVSSRITVDSSHVNYDEPGVYDVIYSVTDLSGNETRITIQVTVILAIDHLRIYYLNDTHGAILENGNQLGLSNIGNFILSEKANYPNNTIFLAGGDMLQGSLLSNYFQGGSMIDLLNFIKLDSFTIGNHEFDWGLETVTDYFNPDTQRTIKANYPLLGANVFFKGTTIRPDFIDAYQVIERGNIKVGVIGLMGYGLEGSIATAMVEDYEFADPIYWAGYYAEVLRLEEEVDVVIAVVHGSSSFTNSGIGNHTGLKRIDALFNGHSHQAYTEHHSRTGMNMPIIQSGGNGTHVGYLKIDFNRDKMITGYIPSNLTGSSDQRLRQSNPEVTELINYYYDQISDLINLVIIKSGANYSRSQLTEYMAELIRMSGQADIGFHNQGGTRASLSFNQGITVGTLYEIFPFDNKVKTAVLRGSIIKDFISSGADGSATTYKEGLSFNQIQDHLYYKVATNEYVFDKTNNPFIYGDDVIDTGIVIRDVLETVLRNQAKSSEYFYINTPIVIFSSSRFNLFTDMIILENAKNHLQS